MQILLVAALPLLGVLIATYLKRVFGQRLESRKLLVSQKALAYADIADAEARICIYGSVGVVQKLRDFESAGGIAISREGQAALTAVLSAMREDVTGISTEQRHEAV